MKYQEKAIINIKNITMAEATKENYRINKNDFTRERKMNFQNVVYYNLNKKGLTSKMEIEDFEKMVNMTDISSSAVLKQREKLNADIYSEIRNTNLQVFYNEYKDDVKLFKGYILSATDGSDFEIPNTKKTRIEFNSTKKTHQWRELLYLILLMY